MYLYSWPFAYFQDDQTTFLKILILFQSRRLAISPLKSKESSWRSLSHIKRSPTQGIGLPEFKLSNVEHQAGNKFNTNDYIFLPASPSSTTPFRVGGSATVDMVTGNTSLMITQDLIITSITNIEAKDDDRLEQN